MILDMAMVSFHSQNQQAKKLFMGILLTEQSVQAVLWSIENEQINILKKSEIFQINQQDQAIVQTDKALQDLGEESEGLKEVIFGLEPSWSDAKGILDNKKPLLKKLTEDLMLEAVGFVVITEAVAKNLLKKQPSLSAVLVFYSGTQVDVTIIENGKVEKTESVGRSEDSVGDLVEALARIKAKHEAEFPPQIKLISISLDKDELYEQQQVLIDHDWVGEGHFISVPTIAMEDLNTAIDGIVNQGGLAVAKVESIKVKENESEEQLQAVIESEPADFAFKEVELPKEVTPDDNLAVVPKSFGIPISNRKLPDIQQTTMTSSIKHDDEHELVPETSKSTKNKPNKLNKWLGKNKLFVGIGFASGLLTLIIIAIVFMMIAGKAQVLLTLNQRPLSKDLSITLDPSLSESNFEKLTLKSELVTKSFSFNQTNETTGTTLVGEKAKGKVQIVNKTDGTKTFTAGTTFTSGSLRFTLDDDVTVASASVEIKQSEEVKTYGSSEANLTAVKIGAEGNINAETTLTVGDFSTSSYEARSIAAFSGGSSRELRVVSENDQAQLLAEVKKKILELAIQQFKDDSSADGQKTFVSTGNLTVTESEYSAKVGDEARTLSLVLVADVQAISYLNQDLKPLAEFVLSDLVPEGFEMVNKEPEILSAVDTSSSGSAVVISANISSRSIPKLDLDGLKKEIAGQKLSSAEAILNGKGEIKSYSINLIPSIMHRLWQKIPTNTNNITISLE